jgi:GntR family transcriptional regulator
MAGDLPPGTQPPSTAHLVAEFGVSNTTVQKALAVLKAEGHLTSRQGKGVYVRDRQPFRVEVAAYFPPPPGGAPRVLADLGYALLHLVDAVSSRMPTSEEIDLLALPDVPVIRQFRVGYSHDDRPVEVSVPAKGAHLYELVYRLPA